MASIRNVPLLEVDVGRALGRVTAPLQKPLSAAAQERILRIVRAEFLALLREVVEEAYATGDAPLRTGRAKAQMLTGGRVFGTSFNSLRGHILGPSYMYRQEFGGILKPVNAEYLTIPMPAALKFDGTPKLPGPRSWRNVLNTFVYTNKKTGNKFIVYKNGGGTLTFLYALVTQARFQPKGFLAKAWRNNKNELVEILGRAMIVEMLSVDLGPLARITTKKGKLTVGASKILGAGRKRR